MQSIGAEIDSPDSYAQSRQFGEATVTIICEADAPWAPQLQVPEDLWRRAMPEADAEGAIPLDFMMACIRIGDATVLVDPGFEEPSSSFERQRALDWKGLRRTPGLFAWLDSAGISPEEVTHVLITHTHHDHYAGVIRSNSRQSKLLAFPNARHFMGRRDWDESTERQQPESEFSLRLGAVERAGKLEFVSSEIEIAPGITMIPAPGETPGHCIVRVQFQGATFYYLGDLFHHTCEVENPDWVSVGRDKVSMRQSRDRLFAVAVPEEATLVFAHNPFPGWGRIRCSGDGHVWERTC